MVKLETRVQDFQPGGIFVQQYEKLRPTLHLISFTAA